MVPRCILLIEDQAEVRRMLRQSLFYLEQGMRIIELPSGEEALLVLSRQTVDLAIVDIRLAGISGLDFLKRARQRQPGLKVILMTGMTDPQTRQLLAGAGAEAYFFKPLEMPPFLQAIKRCLGESREAVPAGSDDRENLPPLDVPVEEPATVINLSSLLDEHRLKSGIACFLLLSDKHEILEMVGTIPGEVVPSALAPVLADVFSASVQLSSFLGVTEPDQLLSFHGPQFNLYLISAGNGRFLTAFSTAPSGSGQPEMQQFIKQAAADLALYFKSQAGLQPAGENGSQEDQAGKGSYEPLAQEAGPDFTDLFNQTGDLAPDNQNLDAFWEEAAAQDEDGNLGDAGRLSFEQARKLGLAPEG